MRAMRTYAKKKEHANVPAGPFRMFSHCACGYNIRNELISAAKNTEHQYQYDELDSLASDGGVAYAYDAAGNRTTKTENGETITYTLGLSDGLASWMSMGSPWMLHLYVVNQSPIVRGCKCFWRPVTSIDGDVPPRGAVPMNGSPAGGGVTFK